LVDPQSTVRDTGGGCGITPGRVAVIAADVALGAVVADKQPASAMAAAQQTGKQTPPLRTIMPLPLALSAISGWFLSSYFRQLVVGKIGEFVQTQWDEHG